MNYPGQLLQTTDSVKGPHLVFSRRPTELLERLANQRVQLRAVFGEVTKLQVIQPRDFRTTFDLATQLYRRDGKVFHV